MKNFAEINQEFRARNAERKAVIGETKLRAFDIVYEKATMEGIVTETKFFKGKCPKNALANFRQEMAKSDSKYYKVIEVVSITEKKTLVYKVFDNKYILR